MLATWIVPTEANVAARTMNPLPVTPAAPFEVRRKPKSCPGVSATLTTTAFARSSLRWLEIGS